MQLYFYDTYNEVENRMKISSNFVESTLIVLIQILKTNPYDKFFRSLSDISNLHHHQIQIRCDQGLDQRVFNTPTSMVLKKSTIVGNKKVNGTLLF